MFPLVRFLIERPRITNLVMVFILLLAGASLLRIKRLGYPRVDYGSMRITTVYPGASPEDVEINVTVKLEDALKSVDGIEEYSSRSVENLSVIDVKIDPDAEDSQQVKSDVRRAIEGVADLPEEVREKPDIFETKVDNFEIYSAVLLLPDYDRRELLRLGRELKRRLLDLPQISKVNEAGISRREIRIELDLAKLRAREVSFQEVMDAIRFNKVRSSGGSVESFTTKRNIVTISEFETVSEVENIIVRANVEGGGVRLGEIAKVLDDFEEEDSLDRFNGRRGMSLWIAKKGPADILVAVEDIERAIERFKAEVAPADLEIVKNYDASIDTEHRITIVYQNAIAGFVLVLAVLFLFLSRNIALWTAVGIPISIALTIVALPFFDVTINSISLCGLVVVLGMVVDDAIIIAESYVRSREKGLPPREAAFDGLGVVIKPVIGTIITTMIAFVPIYFIPGLIGDFAVEIPTIVILMLAASLIEATTILPAHLVHADEDENETSVTAARPGLFARIRGRLAPLVPGPIKNAYHYLFGREVTPGQEMLTRLEGVYAGLLRRALLRKGRAALFVTLFLVGGSFFGGLLTYLQGGFVMFPDDQATKLWLYGEVAKDATLDFNAAQVGRLEKIIDTIPEERGVKILYAHRSYVGWDFNRGAGFVKCANCFILSVELIPATERDSSAAAVRDYIRAEFKKQKIENMTLNAVIESGGPPVGRPLEITVTGNDNRQRKAIIDQLMGELPAYGVIDIDSDYRTGKPELRLLPDHRTIAAAGLNVAAVADTIRTAFDGTVVAQLQTPDEEIPFRVVLGEASRNFDRPLAGLTVRNPAGRLVPLEKLVRTETHESAQNVYHMNSYRTNTITADIDKEKTSPTEVYLRLRNDYRDFAREHPGIQLRFGGEAEKSSEVMGQMIAATLVAVVAIYFLLVVQFDSYSQPLMVILVIPFGLVGVLVAFGLQNMNLSMLALVGVLGYSGVVVNDSLVMVDLMNRLRGERAAGAVETFDEAVVRGAVYRLRPIALTTLTTVVGLIPTAYGLIGGFDSFISPMVMAMTWGLLVGTTSVLFVIPLLYALHHDLTEWLKGRIS